MGTILLGWAAPTEAAALGAFGAVILTTIYGRMSMRTFKTACINTLKISAMIMLVLTGGTMYTGVFLGMGGGVVTEKLLMALNLSPWAMVFLFLFVAFIAGFLLDWISVLLIFVPIFVPIVIKIGFDPIWFGVLIVLTGEMGVITPPVGVNVFVIKGIAPEIPLNAIFKGIFPFLWALILLTIIIMMFPQIATYLPNNGSP